MTCCTLGSRPDIESVTKAMLPVDQGGEGMTVRAVADRFQVKRYLIERHWGCLRAKGITSDRARAAAPESERRPKEPEEEPQTSVQTAKTEDAEGTDSEQTRIDKPSASVTNAARAQSSEESTFRSRTWHIADLIASALYEGRKTNLALAKEWGCSIEAVQSYARTASMLVSKDRNTLEVQREVSLAKIAAIREKALQKTQPFDFACPACKADATIDVPCSDYKAAVAAQKHMDEISGVLVKRTQLQLQVDPVFGQLWGAVARMLEAKHPAALADCEILIARMDAALRRRETIDVVAEDAPLMLQAS